MRFTSGSGKPSAAAADQTCLGVGLGRQTQIRSRWLGPVIDGPVARSLDSRLLPARDFPPSAGVSGSDEYLSGDGPDHCAAAAGGEVRVSGYGRG